MCEGAQGPAEQGLRCPWQGCVCPRHHPVGKICPECTETHIAAWTSRDDQEGTNHGT